MEGRGLGWLTPKSRLFQYLLGTWLVMVHAISNLTQGLTRVAEPGRRAARADQRARGAELSPSAGDRVELSPAALRRTENPTCTMTRAEYIDWLRQEIAAGRYLTADKIDFVVERLYEEVRGG